MNKFLRKILISPLEIMSPRVCLVCGFCLETDSTGLFKWLCPKCYDDFPLSPPGYRIAEKLRNNFEGDELAITNAYSLIHLTKNFKYTNLIHAFKYSGFIALGREMAILLSGKIKRELQCDYDLIIPVPIHKAKKRERGFNQSEIISNELSKLLCVRSETDLVIRKKYTESQTRQNSDADRLKNVTGIFDLKKKSSGLRNKKILVVDDVLTTGATINSLAMYLLENNAAQIDTATLAFAG
jgi:ComF family protein